MAGISEINVPFPDDVPLADLERISLHKLLTVDAAESAKLFHACRTYGFFLLDLSADNTGRDLLQTASSMFDVGHGLFRLDSAEKDKYPVDFQKSLFGYKATGSSTVDTKGTPDRCEWWTLSQDDIMGIAAPLPNPPYITEHRSLFRKFVERSHVIVDVISACLEVQLGLPPETLSSRQRLDRPSQSQYRFIKTPPQPDADRRTSLVPHTDFGTVTVLFNVLGGLQILPPNGNPSNDADWRWVKPDRNCAIINLGDAMVQWTGGILRSNMHRVTCPPGKQASYIRYSLAYFARPESEALMAPLTGKYTWSRLTAGEGESTEPLSASEWVRRKGIALSKGSNPRSSGGVAMAAA